MPTSWTTNGNVYVGNHTEWGKGRFGRFQGMSQNFSFTLNPEKLKKLFGGGDDEDDKDKNKRKDDDDEGMDTDIESNVDDSMEKGKTAAKKVAERRRPIQTAIWHSRCHGRLPSVTVSPCVRIPEERSSTRRTMRYPYKFTQTLNMSGNVRISDGWNISFSSGYDFDNHKHEYDHRQSGSRPPLFQYELFGGAGSIYQL